jgi:hypothetical protein
MEVQLDLIKMGVQKMFSDTFVQEANVDVVKIAVLDMYQLFVTGKIYGEKSLTEYHVKYPADWWQAVKERFAPAWFAKRYPVVYKEHHITIDAVYPELSKRLKLPKESHRLILHSWSGFNENHT